MSVARDRNGFIVTPRLLLRQWRDADRAPFAALNADPRVRAYFPGLQSRAESDASLDAQRRLIAATGVGLWALEARATGVFLGFTGLAHVALGDVLPGEVEIGWRLARSHWGMGYAEEAARAALAVAFTDLDLPRVVSFTAAGNARSWRLMARLGMAHRADLDFEHPHLTPGHPLRPHVVYVIARS